jgi:branched-chain amino acid aminotransferase
LYTPEVTCLPERHHPQPAITLAHDLGIKVVEKRITRDEVYIADEAFFTGTAAEVTPIREVDGRHSSAQVVVVRSPSVSRACTSIQ